MPPECIETKLILPRAHNCGLKTLSYCRQTLSYINTNIVICKTNIVINIVAII
jgi:hypothetical protein